MILYIYLVYRYEKLCLGKVVNVNFFVITWMLIVWYGSFRNKKKWSRMFEGMGVCMLWCKCWKSIVEEMEELNGIL
jgi:hypothetical protein